MAQYPPYACMADAAMATTNALKRVFPDCMRLVCYWHVQRKLRENMSALRAIDAGAADELASDINHLQVLSLDEESFKFSSCSSRSGLQEVVQRQCLKQCRSSSCILKSSGLEWTASRSGIRRQIHR